MFSFFSKKDLVEEKQIQESKKIQIPEVLLQFPLLELARYSQDIYTPGSLNFENSRYIHLRDQYGIVAKYDKHYEDDDENTNILYFIFVFRGTDLSSWVRGAVDILNDLELIRHEFPITSNIINNRLKNSVENIRKDKILSKFFDTVPIYFTGHSLGAIYANSFYAYINDLKIKNKYCITFENPGSDPIIRYIADAINLDDNYIDKIQQNAYVINAYTNIINSMDKQFGQIFQRSGCDPFGDFEKKPFCPPIGIDIPVDYYMNFYYVFDYGFKDTHSINKMVNIIKSCLEGDKNCSIKPSLGFYSTFRGTYLHWLVGGETPIQSLVYEMAWERNYQNVNIKFKNKDEYNYTMTVGHNAVLKEIFKEGKSKFTLFKNPVLQIENKTTEQEINDDYVLVNHM